MFEDAGLFGPTARFAGAGLSNAGRPQLPMRLMIAPQYLKHNFKLSDDELCECRNDNVVCQFFNGMTTTAAHAVRRHADQVCLWDIAKRKGTAKWTCFYLYVTWTSIAATSWAGLIAPRKSAELADQLIADTVARHDILPGISLEENTRQPNLSGMKMVERRRIELPTSALRTQRSPS
jgi:hypothetical protein